jgi:hypothetical protein
VGLKIHVGEPQNNIYGWREQDLLELKVWTTETCESVRCVCVCVCVRERDRESPQNSGLWAVWNKEVERTEDWNRKERKTDATAWWFHDAKYIILAIWK